MDSTITAFETSPNRIIESIFFREMHSGEEDKVCKLVLECFNKFISPGYSKEGIIEFNKYVNPDLLRERLTNSSYSFVALDKEEIVGVIEVRDINHISLLFVKEKCQNTGIAKKLVELSIEKSTELKHLLRLMEVNSSPYAIKVYESLGFVAIDVEQEVNGIRFVPMNLLLN